MRSLWLSDAGMARDFEYARGMLQVAAECALAACSQRAPASDEEQCTEVFRHAMLIVVAISLALVVHAGRTHCCALSLSRRGMLGVALWAKMFGFWPAGWRQRGLRLRRAPVMSRSGRLGA